MCIGKSGFRLGFALIARMVVFVTLAMGVSFSASAQMPKASPTPKPPPKKIEQPGEPIRWEFSDGREITLFIEKDAPRTFDLSAQIGESTCHEVPERAPKCRLVLPAMITRFEARWTKTPDAARLNKVVINASPGGSDLSTTYSPGVYASRFQPAEHPGLGKLQLVCDNFSWLTGEKEAPETLELLSLSTELMGMNPETGVNENMTISGIYSPQFKRVSADRMELETTGDWYGTETFYAMQMFLFGDLFHLVGENPNGGVCQTTMKPGFPSLYTEVEKHIKSLPGNFTPYLSGQDTFYKAAQPLGGGVIEFLLGNSEDAVR